LIAKFSVQLDKLYLFETPDPTPISAKASETEIKKATAVFEFKVSHS